MGGAISALTRVCDALWPRCLGWGRAVRSARYPSSRGHGTAGDDGYRPTWSRV